jgi:hypothetical protein
MSAAEKIRGRILCRFEKKMAEGAELFKVCCSHKNLCEFAGKDRNSKE